MGLAGGHFFQWGFLEGGPGGVPGGGSGPEKANFRGEKPLKIVKTRPGGGFYEKTGGFRAENGVRRGVPGPELGVPGGPKIGVPGPELGSWEGPIGGPGPEFGGPRRAQLRVPEGGRSPILGQNWGFRSPNLDQILGFSDANFYKIGISEPNL